MGVQIHRRDIICNKCRKHGNQLFHNANNEEDRNDSQETAAPLTRQNTAIDQESNASEDNELEFQEHANDPQNSEIEEDNAVETTENCNSRKNDYEVMFEKLKTKFSECEKNDPLRVQILTLVPDHWTLQKTADKFNTTIWLARKARVLLDNEGVW